MEKVLETLNILGIVYEKYDHPAVFTVEEADAHYKDFYAGKSKNIFIRNQKKDHYYLIVLESSKRINMKEVSAALGERPMSFASPDDLKKYLDLTPGSVSPFGLINNAEKNVKVIIDTDLMKYEK